jgi:hypothetical protein
MASSMHSTSTRRVIYSETEETMLLSLLIDNSIVDQLIAEKFIKKQFGKELR